MLAFLESVGGLGFAILGAALTAGLCCIGSAKGTGMVGEAAAGLTSEDPDKSTKCLILQVLPGTQGLYGFVALFLVLGQTGLLSGSVLDVSLTQGMSFFAACLPIMLGGWLSAIFQGRVWMSSLKLESRSFSPCPDKVYMIGRSSEVTYPMALVICPSPSKPVVVCCQVL